jgi:hypothetical protein
MCSALPAHLCSDEQHGGVLVEGFGSVAPARSPPDDAKQSAADPTLNSCRRSVPRTAPNLRTDPPQPQSSLPFSHQPTGGNETQNGDRPPNPPDHHEVHLPHRVHASPLPLQPGPAADPKPVASHPLQQDSCPQNHYLAFTIRRYRGPPNSASPRDESPQRYQEAVRALQGENGAGMEKDGRVVETEGLHGQTADLGGVLLG